jgi:peptidoglycan hydrolase CwlO-like protein
MKTKTCIIVGLFFAFFLSVGSRSIIQAQQENDDPNWRERKLEELKKETERLTNEFKKAEREFEEIRRGSQERNRKLLGIYEKEPSTIPNSRFMDIYDYGPISNKRGLI